jgi:hypothetical protein
MYRYIGMIIFVFIFLIMDCKNVKFILPCTAFTDMFPRKQSSFRGHDGN